MKESPTYALKRILTRKNSEVSSDMESMSSNKYSNFFEPRKSTAEKMDVLLTSEHISDSDFKSQLVKHILY